MARVREGTHLNVSPEIVWPFIVDPEKIKLWRRDTRILSMPDGGIFEAGSSCFIEKELGTRPHTFECSLTELEENRKFTFTGEAPGYARVETSYEIIPRQKGCLFIVSEKVDLLNVNFFKSFFLSLFIKKTLANTDKCFLGNLKNIVESQGDQPTATWHSAMDHMW